MTKRDHDSASIKDYRFCDAMVDEKAYPRMNARDDVAAEMCRGALR